MTGETPPSEPVRDLMAALRASLEPPSEMPEVWTEGPDHEPYSAAYDATPVPASVPVRCSRCQVLMPWDGTANVCPSCGRVSRPEPASRQAHRVVVAEVWDGWKYTCDCGTTLGRDERGVRRMAQQHAEAMTTSAPQGER